MPREAAYRILTEIEKGAYANLALDDYLDRHELSSSDRAFVTEIVYGTVRYQLKMDWIIDQLVKKTGKLETGPRLLLRMSFYQLLFMKRVPPFAVTSEAVRLAKKLFHAGVAGLVNGVLRSYLRCPKQVKWPDCAADPARFLAVVHSHPLWMVKRWIARYGFQASREICEFNNRPADLWIRTNTLKISPERLASRLKEEGCVVEKGSRVPEALLLKEGPNIGSLPSFQEGLFTVQDESSMLVSHVLRPQAGQVVLDTCAGPGGKSTHLAQLMKNKGLVVACDVHEHRLRLIEDNAARLGIKIIETRLRDAASAGWEPDEKYDLVLVDAPCSGLGVLRRRPDSRWRKKEEDIKVLADLQAQILDNAVRLVRPGGRIVYSTCTIEPEENAGVVERIKGIHRGIRSVDLNPLLPYRPSDEQEKRDNALGFRQYLPFKDGMEGFFIAGLEKVY
ncbi:MAG: 16S rRNA (cytosine(967)-C(5))-methyltransferase RsmB [Peptococcaceae bacterium]|jgi:16S rRNA (cytosine967-C5)-methyltransferase|nr:16S rRNA (cytosine(967)-C(5))-methyltransferase RsmB [Peptococcaceae bacterium]MDH7524289.1 16S rRNA (cytosine(967)-C(5))-methyltransferase RsmB [Peptococcaceae bacterium]